MLLPFYRSYSMIIANLVCNIGISKLVAAADLGFNFRGCAMSRTREYKWNWGVGGVGGFRDLEANAFSAICTLKPV